MSKYIRDSVTDVFTVQNRIFREPMNLSFNSTTRRPIDPNSEWSLYGPGL